MQEQLAKEEQEKLNTSKSKKGINMTEVMEYVTYFLEHLEELLIDTANPLKRAAFFGLIFDEMPTYADLTSGTPKLAPYLALKRDLGGNLVPFGEPTGARTRNTRLKRPLLYQLSYRPTMGLVENNELYQITVKLESICVFFFGCGPIINNGWFRFWLFRFGGLLTFGSQGYCCKDEDQ